MKAAILDKLHEPLTIADITFAPHGYGKLDHGQVYVRILCAGLCGAQLQEIDGHKGDPSHLPHLLGHEGCGVVQTIGPGVSTVKVGDKVVLHWKKGAGCDVGGATFNLQPSTLVKSGPITTFSEYTIVSENRCTAIPQDVPDDFACLLGCCLSTALGVIENEAKVKFGESVLIIGLGGLGLSVAIAARLAQAHPIVAIDISQSKGEYAAANRIEFVANKEALLKHASPPFDTIIDTTGTVPYLDLLATKGRYVVIGQPKVSSPTPPITRDFVDSGKRIIGSQGGCFNPTVDIPRYVNLWRSGALDNYQSLITHRLPLDHINEGFDLMRAGKAGRVLIEFE